MRLKQVSTYLLPLLFLLVMAAAPLIAQKSGGSTSKPSGTAAPSGIPGVGPNIHPQDEWTIWNIPRTITGEPQVSSSGPPRCFHWPVSGTVSAMVSTTQLEVPDKAYKYFDDACSEVTAKKLAKARENLEKAVQAYLKYAAAWVLLGQVQRDQQDVKEAAQSCRRGLEIDAGYLAPYLCLADLAARANQWDQVAALTNQVLARHPVKSPGAYYYNSLANLNLHQLEDAEKSGLRAAEEGMTEQKLQAHWLLAKIYEEKGDRASEATQLREYLKLAPHSPDSEKVNSILQEIEARQQGKK